MTTVMNAVKKVAFSVHGVTPLIMHSTRGMLPTNPYKDELRALLNKRGKKTAEDILRLQRIEWELGLYLAPDGKTPIIPSDCIFANVCEAARGIRKGKDWMKGVDIEADAPLGFEDSGKSLEWLWASGKYLDLRFLNVNRAKVLRARPIFREWTLDFTVVFRPDIIDSVKEVISVVTTAGENGFMESRPRYGRYVVTSAEEVGL